MDEATHKAWWPLHLRAALGETLTADEQANYESGLKQMEAEEEQALNGSVENLKKARQKNLELKSEYNRLRLQIEEIEKYSVVFFAGL